MTLNLLDNITKLWEHLLCEYDQCMSNCFVFIKNRIRIPPLSKSVFLSFDLDLVTLTFMSLKNAGMVVMFTHTELVIAEYGNECLTKHKLHETPPKPLDSFYII